MPVLVMELYKLLWVKKGIVVLAIAVVIVSNTCIKKGYTYDSDLAVAMKYYSEAKDMQLSDELSDIVYRYEQESEYWNDRLKQINTAFANETKEFTREDMNEATMQVSLYKKGLEEIHRNINNLEYLKEKNITGEVTMPFAVEEMLGEKKQNMLISIHTAKRGRLSWCMMKLCAVLIVSICIGVVIFIPDIVNITRVYKIDGRFSDWDAVTKYDAGCPNAVHEDCIEKTAMVFDGDYVYIYIKDGDTGSAYGAGSHSNGMYTIKSDMGNEMVFQLTQDGDINGVDKAECKHVGKQWEIAIPKSELPTYNNTISFGLYLTEPFIENVSNLDESKGVEISTDITYDGLKGLYGDWDRYPHTTIEYATAGTHYQIVDSKGALYCDGGSTLLGHVVTTMPNHVDKEKDAGGEFMSAVTIKFNNNEKQVFSPRLVSVDEAGNINWNTPNGGYEDGTYEFYIFSTHDAWNNAGNIYEDSINRENSEWYGKMTITVKNGVQDECEFYLDLEKVAKKFGCDASDFKRIDAQFGRLGQQWITTAGASSGAWLGLILCVGVTAGVLVYQKKKGNRQVS